MTFEQFLASLSTTEEKGLFMLIMIMIVIMLFSILRWLTEEG